MCLILYGSWFIEQTIQFITLDIILSGINLHTVFSVKSTMSPEATGETAAKRLHLLLMQFTSPPDTYCPVSHSLAGKSHFSKASDLRKEKRALLSV